MRTSSRFLRGHLIVTIVCLWACGRSICAQSPRIVRLPKPAGELVSAPPVKTQDSLPARQRMFANRQPVPLSLDQLTIEALKHSLRIRILSAQVHERRADGTVADAQFDWRSFIETSWRDSTEPVGSSLDTGNPNGFLRTHDLTYQAGIRKRNSLGGEFQFGQEYQLEDSNSQFFVPGQQGTTTMRLTYDQPLLKRGGQLVQRGMVIVAHLRGDAQREKTLQGMQNHLLEVYEAYWSLWSARANLVKVRQAHDRADGLLKVIRLREHVDGQMEPILRAESATALRKAMLIQSERTVFDRQARLRLLVNGPLFHNLQHVELIPTDAPLLQQPLPPLSAAFQQAVRNRPDIAGALIDVKSAGLEKDIAQHELLPELNLVLESYVRGLRGDYRVAGAFRGQFQEGDPTYRVALEFEAPWYNRKARAELQRKRWELQRLRDEFQLTMEQVWLDVDMALRNASSLEREVHVREEVVRRLRKQWRYSEDRYRLMLTDGRTSTLYLEDLLNVQTRLSDAEASLERVKSEYVISRLSLHRATGALLAPGSQR